MGAAFVPKPLGPIFSGGFLVLLKKRSLVWAGAVAMSAAGVARATTPTNWGNSGGGAWTNAVNWDNGVPGSTSDANFNLNSSTGYTVTSAAGPAYTINVKTDRVTLDVGTGFLTTQQSINSSWNIGTGAGEVAYLTLTGSGGSTGTYSGYFVGGSGVGHLKLTGNITVHESLHGPFTIASGSDLTLENGASIFASSTFTNNGTTTVNAGTSIAVDKATSTGALNLLGGTLGNTTGGSTSISGTVLINNGGSFTGSASTQTGPALTVSSANITINNGGFGSPNADLSITNSTVNATKGSIAASNSGQTVNTVTNSTITGSGGTVMSLSKAYITGTGSGSSVSLSDSTSKFNGLNLSLGFDSSNNAGTGSLKLDNGASLNLTPPNPFPGAILTVGATSTFELDRGARANVSTFTTTGDFKVGISGSDPTLYGKLISALNQNSPGNANFGGTLDVSLLDGYTPLDNTSFDILDFVSHTGTFATVNLPALAPGQNWDTSQLYTTGVITVVPEPTTIGLGLVLGGAMLMQRRKRAC